MGYEKQTWVDDESPLSAARLNNMEQGIYDAFTTLMVPGITVEAGVAHGDFIYPDIVEEAEVWKKDTGNAIGRYLCGPVTDGIADAVRAGVMPMPSALALELSASDIAGQYSIYVQSDGSLDLGVTPIHAGIIRSAAQIMVDFNPTNAKPKAYTDPMAKFFAIAGPTGNMWLKIELPTSATGAHIYRGTTEYAGEGMENWGTWVATITDDTGFKGDNEWFIDDDGGSNLVNGTTYYYKAFPYAGTVVNETAGVNETVFRAGLLQNEWSPNNVSGNTIIDAVGGANAAMTNISISPNGGLIGDSFLGSGGYATIAQQSTYDRTFCIWMLYNGAASGLFGKNSQSARYANFGGQANAGTRYTTASKNAVAGWNLVAVYFGYQNGQVKVSVNGSAYNAVTLNDYSIDTTFNLLFGSKKYTDPFYGLNTHADVFRIFTGELTVAELKVLINGGAGC